MEIIIVLIVIILAGFLQQKTYGQCSGRKAVISQGDGFIESPNYPNELGKAANCTWEFALSSDLQEYILTLTVVWMRTYYVVDGKKVCSGFNKVKWNQDEINCLTYLNPQYGSKFCSSYYSFNKCETLNQTCKTVPLTSFPVIVTYESDGKVLQGHNRGPVSGFKMEYSYNRCPSETTTAMHEHSSTSRISTNAELQTTRSFTSFGKLQQSTSQERTNRYIGNSQITDSKITIPGNTESKLSQRQIIMIASSGGGGLILFIVVIIICSCKRKNKSSNDSVELNDIDGSADLVVMTKTEKPDNNVANCQSLTRISNSPSQSEKLDSPLYSTPIDNPSDLILYSTVDETPIQNTQSVEPVYSTVPKDQGVQSKCGSKVDDQSNMEKFSDDESSSVDQPDVLYSAVTTNKNRKKTFTYNKTIVSNILYVPAERDDAETVEEAVYDIN